MFYFPLYDEGIYDINGFTKLKTGDVKELGQRKEKKEIFIEKMYTDDPEQFFENWSHFQELMMMYHSAILEVTTKFNILNDELSFKSYGNPIESIKSRIKKPLSIAKKLDKIGKEVTTDNIIECLNDVAGIRVICSFVEDVYKVADMLVKQDDITLIKVKDYIKNPKPNGYRSYHMIIEVPVFFSDRKQPMRVEVQLRTVAMDFWASLEHQLKYKNDQTDAEEIVEELKVCAKTIADTDLKMQELRRRIRK